MDKVSHDKNTVEKAGVVKIRALLWYRWLLRSVTTAKLVAYGSSWSHWSYHGVCVVHSFGLTFMVKARVLK